MRTLGELLLSKAGYQSLTDIAEAYLGACSVCHRLDLLVLLDYDGYGGCDRRRCVCEILV